MPFGSHCHSKSIKLINKNIIAKQFKSPKIFKRELKVLQKLQSYDFVPKIIEVEEETKTIKMSYCGKQMSIASFLKHRDEIDRLVKKIKKETGIYHNDLKPRNVCYRKGKIYLIDFSQSSKEIHIHKSGKVALNSINNWLTRVGRTHLIRK